MKIEQKTNNKIKFNAVSIKMESQKETDFMYALLCCKPILEMANEISQNFLAMKNDLAHKATGDYSEIQKNLQKVFEGYCGNRSMKFVKHINDILTAELKAFKEKS